MNVRSGVLAAALICANLMAEPVPAQSTAAAARSYGRIAAIRATDASDVQILSSGGVRRQARTYDYLQPGDQVLINGATTTVVVETRRHGRRTLTADSPTFVAPSGGGRALGAEVARFLGRFDYMFERGARPLSRPTAARGEGNGEWEDARSNFALALEGPQSVSPSLIQLAPVWNGNAAMVKLELEGEPDPVVRRVFGKQIVRLPLAADARGGTLTLEPVEGRAVSIVIRRADPPILPAFVSGARDDAERDLAAALWLLTEAGPEWRLEGLSRLALQSESDPVAAQLLDGFLTDPLAAPAQE